MAGSGLPQGYTVFFRASERLGLLVLAILLLAVSACFTKNAVLQKRRP